MTTPEESLPNQWIVTKTENGIQRELDLPQMKITHFDIFQKQVPPESASNDDIEDAKEYNDKFGDVPQTRSVEVVLNSKEKMVELVTSYAYWIHSGNEVEVQNAAADETILVDGKSPMAEKYRVKISAELSELKDSLTDAMDRDFGNNETWYSVIGGSGGDIVMCSKDDYGKFRMSISGLKNYERFMYPPDPTLSTRTLIWLRDAGLQAPSDITAAQLQKIFADKDSLMGGRDTDSTIQYEDFVTANGKTIKVLKPFDEKSVINN